MGEVKKRKDIALQELYREIGKEFPALIPEHGVDRDELLVQRVLAFKTIKQLDALNKLNDEISDFNKNVKSFNDESSKQTSNMKKATWAILVLTYWLIIIEIFPSSLKSDSVAFFSIFLASVIVTIIFTFKVIK